MLKNNILSILVALIIMYLSLASSQTFENVPLPKIPHIDKIVHFLMYFGLMSTIIFENRKTLKTTRNLFLISLIPLFYGILMEILQGVFTATRFASFFDVVFDAAGIYVCILLWLWVKTFKKDRIR
jgi:VanZ family protein